MSVLRAYLEKSYFFKKHEILHGAFGHVFREGRFGPCIYVF